MHLKRSYRMTEAQWREQIQPYIQPRKVKLKQRKAATKRQPVDYLIKLPTNEQSSVLALTKGEARATMKKQLGLSRLPVNTKVEIYNKD